GVARGRMTVTLGSPPWRSHAPVHWLAVSGPQPVVMGRKPRPLPVKWGPLVVGRLGELGTPGVVPGLPLLPSFVADPLAPPVPRSFGVSNTPSFSAPHACSESNRPRGADKRRPLYRSDLTIRRSHFLGR